MTAPSETPPEEIEVARRNLLAELKTVEGRSRNNQGLREVDDRTLADLIEVLEALKPSPRGDHLTPKTTGRGFDHYPEIPGAYGGTVRVYESSAASGPHVWLAATESPLHLTAENATKLAEQLLALVAGHYQNGGGS